jgi:hypothetical protein
MANNSTKTNNHLSLQLIEHKKNYDISRWNSRSWRRISTILFRIKPVTKICRTRVEHANHFTADVVD